MPAPSPLRGRVVRGRVVLVLTLAALLLAACGEAPAESGVRTFVGTAEGSDVFVGLGVEGENVVAFLTDGRRIGVWFTGPLQGNAMYLEGPGADRMNASIGDDGASGTATVGNRSYSFSAPEATGRSGLYRAQGSEGEVTGWIVLPDGRQKGVRTDGKRTSPAPDLSLFPAAADE